MSHCTFLRLGFLTGNVRITGCSHKRSTGEGSKLRHLSKLVIFLLAKFLAQSGLMCLGGEGAGARASDTCGYSSPWLPLSSLGQSPTRPPLSPWPGLPRDAELQCLSQSPLLPAHYVALS